VRGVIGVKQLGRKKPQDILINITFLRIHCAGETDIKVRGLAQERLSQRKTAASYWKLWPMTW
jgi:hypothetical protein